MIEEKAAKLLKDASLTANKIAELVLTFERNAGEEDKLFGSVTSKDVGELLQLKGYDIDRRKIVIEEPIKRLGSYKASIKLRSDVTAEVTIEVIKKEDN
jgi:large subunit ribosomal protein L9